MDLIIRLQVYIVSLSVLLIIYIQLKEESESYSVHDQLFRYMVVSTIATLVFEAISWSADGKLGTVAYIINMSVNILLFMTNTIPLTLWTLYIVETTNSHKGPIIKGLLIMKTLVIINMLMALSAPINQKYFYIDANNVYHRGEWSIIGNMVHVILIIVSFLIISHNWDKVNQKNRRPILLFTVPPTIGFIVQTMYYGTSLVWPGATISILMSYIMLQSQVVKVDYLTGLYNRRELDSYIDRKIRNLPKSKKFAGVMIDLDDFKKINDQYGHSVGDKAIKTAASLIKRSFKKDDFVARYGGDEFVIILDIKEEQEMSHKVQHLKRQFELFNKEKEDVFRLEISVGYGIYTWGDGQGDEFLHHLDQLMYENKKERKSRKEG
ncbi:MAG TPA: GGDEF domain-containing protein [Epulopiscium sp.]|nr:GGDEF domain-containing protein [Candidatus Epulonipiscium sp.]